MKKILKEFPEWRVLRFGYDPLQTHASAALMAKALVQLEIHKLLRTWIRRQLAWAISG